MGASDSSTVVDRSALRTSVTTGTVAAWPVDDVATNRPETARSMRQCVEPERDPAGQISEFCSCGLELLLTQSVGICDVILSRLSKHRRGWSAGGECSDPCRYALRQFTIVRNVQRPGECLRRERDREKFGFVDDDLAEVLPGHGQYEPERRHVKRRQWPTSVITDVEAMPGQNCYRRWVSRFVPFQQSARGNFKRCADRSEVPPEKRAEHRRAADIGGANDENLRRVRGFHAKILGHVESVGRRLELLEAGCGQQARV